MTGVEELKNSTGNKRDYKQPQQSKATQHNATHYVLVEKVPIVVEKCGHVIDCAKNNMNVRDSEVR